VRLGAADDERSGHTEVNEVAGPEWCSSGFDSPPRGGDGDSPSPATRRARPGHYEMMRRLAAGVRALRNGGGRTGVTGEVQFIGARPGADTESPVGLQLRTESMDSAVSRSDFKFLFPD
jgi:hypothetical protein